jgi:hypothetical protein
MVGLLLHYVARSACSVVFIQAFRYLGQACFRFLGFRYLLDQLPCSGAVHEDDCGLELVSGKWCSTSVLYHYLHFLHIS